MGSWHLIPAPDSAQLPAGDGDGDGDGDGKGVGDNDGDVDGKGGGDGDGKGDGVSGDAVAQLCNGRLGASRRTDKKEDSELALPGSVCVLIPVRNGQKHLSECLRSLLTKPQGCPFKILLIDDGSTDDTMKIASAIKEELKCGVFSASNPGKDTVV